MPKCDFNKFAMQLFEITLRYECSLVGLLHIFRMTFSYKHLCRAASEYLCDREAHNG